MKKILKPLYKAFFAVSQFEKPQIGLVNSPRIWSITSHICSSRTMSAKNVKIRENDINVSEEDERKYRGLILNNDLKVMLISDPSTDKSAAALDVHIGSMSDPWELPGLAHFCEHMLFMGTEKFPNEDAYNKYLAEHSGCSNAYTAVDHTNYYFDVAPDFLSEALNRFAQFFISPLFTVSGVDREVNAVNSEHEKNKQNDYWRLAQVEKCTCNSSHDFCKFGSGNKETLDIRPKDLGIDVRGELLQFHKKYYSSNIMALSVLGKESLDELEEMAATLFCDVPNGNIDVPSWNDHPFTEEQCKKKLYVLPVKDIRNLNITFPIPDLHEHYKTAPGHYLGHLIGHEGPGSLLSYLKSEGWVNSLVGGQKSGAKGFAFFVVNVDLTEEGILHVDDIVKTLFEYLNLLRENGPEEWIFNECRDINRMNFRFKDKEIPQAYVCAIAELLHYYPLKETLSGGILISLFKKNLITSILECLTPDKIRIMVIGKALANEVDQKEKWYSTEYKLLDLDMSTISLWKEIGDNESLKLPIPNEFIPTNFELIKSKESVSDVPILLSESSLHRMWYKLDTEFNLPKASLFIEFFSHTAYLDPQHTNLLHMFAQLFRDSLTEYAYSAELAGLGYSLINTKYGLTLKIKGYNDKQKVLLKKIIEKLTTFSVNAKRFEILKDAYVRALRNFAADQPHQHLVYYNSLLLSEQGWSKEELLNCIDELTVENLEPFIGRFLYQLHLEFLIHGNISQDYAQDLCDMVVSAVESGANTKPLLSSQLSRQREYQLPTGCSYVYRSENAVHKSSAVENFYQFGQMETRENMLAELLVQIFREPAFNELRTKEQLGYIVLCNLRRSNGTQGLRFIIQGELSPEYLDSRIEAFLFKMNNTLEMLTEEEFERHKEALAVNRLERPKKLYHLSTQWWMEITSGQYHFNRDKMEVEYLRTLTKGDILQFYKRYVSYDALERKKLCLHVKSTAANEEEGATEEQNGPKVVLPEPPAFKEADEIPNLSSFKNSLALYPLMKPYINITMDSKSKL